MFGGEDGPYAENSGVQYKLNTLKEFQMMKDFALHKDGWKLKFSSPKIQVESRTPDLAPGEKPTGTDIFRVNCEYPNVQAEVCFNALHDADYRRTWDENMIEGYNICKLDDHNDIGYYSIKCPRPVSNRDFCNVRCWMEFTNGDYIIMNYSVPHPECPEKKGFVRALSKKTAYFMRPNPDTGGMTMIYITYSDLKVSLPGWLLNYVTGKVAPNTLGKLEKCAENYVEWAAERYPPGHVYKWRTPKVAWDGSTEAAARAMVNAAARDLEQSVDVPGEATAPESTSGPPDQNAVALQLASQVEDLKRKLFLASQKTGEQSSLAPVAPAQREDTIAIQQYRAIMNDAVNYVDRQFLQEGRTPTKREYLLRLHMILEGMRRTMPVRY